MAVQRIDREAVRKCIDRRLADRGRDKVFGEMRQLQVAVYVMCSGGFTGRAAACQPGDFTLDDRGRRPYSATKIQKGIDVLAVYAEALGIDPNRLPDYHDGQSFFDCHNCEIW